MKFTPSLRGFRINYFWIRKEITRSNLQILSGLRIVQYALLFVFLILYQATAAQNFYSKDSIQTIEIQFTESEWDYKLDTAKRGSEGVLMAAWIKINGVQLDSVAVKYKGNSSFDSNYKKNPLNIDLDTYKNQDYQGFSSIKLSNCYADPSMIREVLAYNILSNYMDCPRANFAKVYINGNYIGLYSNTESINKKFCAEHFNSSGNTFVKCNPIVKPSTNTKSNLKYISADTSAYQNYYELKSKTGWQELVALTDSISKHPENLDKFMDIDRLIWMLAFNQVLVNLDSYSGVFCQNYYIYQSGSGHYLPIVWDLNMAFGAFPFAGSGNSSMATLSATQMEQMPLGLHSTDVHWPLIKAIQANATWKRMYAAHIKTLTTEFFANNQYQTLATKYAALIDKEVLADSNKFYSYGQFQQGMTGGVNIGTYTVPGISSLMAARNIFLQTTIEFTSQQPTIGAVSFSNSNPRPGDKVTLTATVSNASNGVYVYYRFADFEPFLQTTFYDDGNHADGAAADGVYGGEITMNAYTCEYYLYAENSNAGIFSPARAAHEFYTFGTALKIAKKGEVLLNEFLAQNQNDSTTSAGQHEDWIELANTTSSDLLLDSLYLTDDFATPEKYVFPTNTIIPANGYLLLWADGNTQAGAEIHCGFKLSAAGEQLMLSNEAGIVYDSLSFGEQKVDTSTGRCYKNGWKWEQLSYPTAGRENQCWPLTTPTISQEQIRIFPNPANEVLYIEIPSNTMQRIQVSDATGRLVYSEICSGQLGLSTQDWATGIYFLQVDNTYVKFAVVH